MARTYILRNLADEKSRPLGNVWCRAYAAAAPTVVIETQYTDATGTCTFTTLPENDNVNILAVWGDNAKWFYNVYSATQDLLFLSVTDAVISTCSIGKLTAGNLTVTGTITTGKFVTGAAGSNRIEIDANYVAGYNSSNVLQFYLSAADGKAYCGAGSVVLDSAGITLNYSAGLTWLSLKDGTYTHTVNQSGTALEIHSAVGGMINLDTKGSDTDLAYCIRLNARYMVLPTHIDFAPSVEGNCYYDTGAHVLFIHNGTTWKSVAWA